MKLPPVTSQIDRHQLLMDLGKIVYDHYQKNPDPNPDYEAETPVQPIHQIPPSSK